MSNYMNWTMNLEDATTLGLSDDGYAIIRVPVTEEAQEVTEADMIDELPALLCSQPHECTATLIEVDAPPQSAPLPYLRPSLPREAALLYHRLNSMMVEIVDLLEDIENKFEVPE